MEASQNEFVEKSGMPDRVKSFLEVDRRGDRPKARPGFFKSIENTGCLKFIVTIVFAHI